jgi:hypothetical protein
MKHITVFSDTRNGITIKTDIKGGLSSVNVQSSEFSFM